MTHQLSESDLRKQVELQQQAQAEKRRSLRDDFIDPLSAVIDQIDDAIVRAQARIEAAHRMNFGLPDSEPARMPRADGTVRETMIWSYCIDRRYNEMYAITRDDDCLFYLDESNPAKPRWVRMGSRDLILGMIDNFDKLSDTVVRSYVDNCRHQIERIVGGLNYICYRFSHAVTKPDHSA